MKYCSIAGQVGGGYFALLLGQVADKCYRTLYTEKNYTLVMDHWNLTFLSLNVVKQ